MGGNERPLVTATEMPHGDYMNGICMCIYACVYISIYVYICSCIYIYICVCVCVYTYMHVRVCVQHNLFIWHVYTWHVYYTYKYIYIYIYIYIYVHETPRRQGCKIASREPGRGEGIGR